MTMCSTEEPTAGLPSDSLEYFFLIYFKLDYSNSQTDFFIVLQIVVSLKKSHPSWESK